MTPQTNHDVEISIYYDFLEDQGIIVDRDPEEQDQWCHEYKCYIINVGGGDYLVGGGDYLVGNEDLVGNNDDYVGGGDDIGGSGVGGYSYKGVSERIGG